MNQTHLRPFLDAMQARNASGLAHHLSDGVTLRSPIFAEPFEGKEKVLGVLSLILEIADEFRVTKVLTDDAQAAVFVAIRAGDDEVQGVDDVQVDQSGSISSMTIQWRPLDAVVAMQRRLAPKIGVPALELVAISSE